MLAQVEFDVRTCRTDGKKKRNTFSNFHKNERNRPFFEATLTHTSALHVDCVRVLATEEIVSQKLTLYGLRKRLTWMSKTLNDSLYTVVGIMILHGIAHRPT